MLKEEIEKVKALVKIKDAKGKKKIENLVFFLIISVITLIAINFVFKSDDKKENKNFESNNVELVLDDSTKSEVSVESNLEKDLEKILTKIKGVGNVEVLITYNQSSKITPMYNETSSQSITEENDSAGGTRKTESYDSNKEVISDANSNPVTEKITLPQIEGAIVIAKGAENITVKNNIIAAVEAATGLSSHKIQVFEMKGEN